MTLNRTPLPRMSFLPNPFLRLCVWQRHPRAASARQSRVGPAGVQPHTALHPPLTECAIVWCCVALTHIVRSQPRGCIPSQETPAPPAGGEEAVPPNVCPARIGALRVTQSHRAVSIPLWGHRLHRVGLVLLARPEGRRNQGEAKRRPHSAQVTLLSARAKTPRSPEPGVSRLVAHESTSVRIVWIVEQQSMR